MDKISKIYVINLKRREDRLKIFENITPLKNYTVFEAYDSQKINEYNNNFITTVLNKTKNYQISYSVLGCFASHYEIWNGIVKNGEQNKYYIIFEDDVQFSDDYVVKLENAIENVKDLDFYILYIGSVWKKDFIPKKLDLFFTKVKNNIYKYKFQPFLIKNIYSEDLNRQSHSYMITYSGAKYLIERANEFIKNKFSPVDHFLHAFTDYTKILHVVPYINWSPIDIDTDIQKYDRNNIIIN